MIQPPYYRSPGFWGVADLPAFNAALDAMIAACRVKVGWFASDNLIAIGRNLGFVTDPTFVKAWQTHATTSAERAIIWRTHTAVWAAKQAVRREGAFVECGCYRGTTARIQMDCVDLSDRDFYLYDLFEHDASMPHHAMPAHSKTLFDEVKARFDHAPKVRVIQGPVPSSFAQGIPDKVAFAHIDMNNAEAEIGALEALESRLVPGAVILLDDFGAIPYRAQHIAETKWFADRGLAVLELPTSQGLVIW